MKWMVLGVTLIGLTSCGILENETNTSLNYPIYSYDESTLYHQHAYRLTEDDYKIPNKEVRVPESYHVGSYHSPVSFHEREQSWVTRQNPGAYTIELAEGEKASVVAQSLYKAPKNQRMAQLKSVHGHKTYYRAVYGSYATVEEAQQALEALPTDLKNSAVIKTWNKVQ